jgi:WD40 repeat protein
VPTPENRPWQVRLLGPTGVPVGGGVLVDDDHVLTCAHVVRDALGVDIPTAQPPAGSVRVDFVGSEAVPLEATVEAWADVADDGRGDVAVLKLSERAPRGTEPAPVRRSEGILGHDFDVLGFPRGYDDGLSSSGTIRRPAGVTGEWVELSVPAGTLVERGFSGSPVLDEELGAVVGIIVGSDRDREHRVAWMIPVRTLTQYWPPLDGVVRHWSMYPRSEFVSHWSPRSRGVERHSSRGSFFTGRQRAMKELSDWLATGPADGRVRVVTGGPGSGKSAVLARLAVLADPLVRPMITKHPDEPAPPIDVAVHARGKTTADILSAITSAVGMPPSSVETWLDDLAQLGRPVTVLVDAVDEAIEPLETGTLLRRTASVGAEGPVKVLVGTRPGYEQELLHQLGTRAVVLDLDDEAYLDRADLAEYVHRRLTSREAPYEGSEQSAGQVAEVIAARSYPSFLLAQLSTSALALAGPVDLEVAGWESRFAESVADGWHDYLDRFGNHRRRVQDLLMPLAYAQGSGLGIDDDLWPGLASALSGRRYDGRDVEWLLEHAAAYLVQELVQDDRPVYRLYHQTLVEYLRRLSREPEAWRRFGRHLVEEVPRRLDGLRDWTRARAYSRTHLPTHAAEAGLLDDLVTDPLFLAVADPDRLAHVLRMATGERAQAIAPAYLDALPELGPSVDDNVNYLTLAAHLIGPPELVERLGRLEPQVPLPVLWATAISAVRSQYLAGATGGAAAFAPIVVDGRTCLAVCALDGTVRIWDADGYAPRGPELALPGGVGTPFLTAATVDGRPVLVTGRHDRLLVVDLFVAGETVTPEVATTMTFEDVSVTAVAVSAVDGVAMVAIGCHDGCVELRRLDQLSEATIWQVHEGPVLSAQLVGDELVTAGADGTVKLLTVNPALELMQTASMEMDATWTNEARLVVTADHGAVLAAGYADGFLDWWRENAERPSQQAVTASTEYGTYQEMYDDGGFSVTTTTGSGMKTLEAIVAAERQRRQEARERDERDASWAHTPTEDAEEVVEPGPELPGAGGAAGQSESPEESTSGEESPGDSATAEEDDNFRILTLRAGTTSVDVTTIGSRLLLVAGGHDGRVVLVEHGASNHVLQAAGPSISMVRFVHSAGRCSVVASDRGAGAVRDWALSEDGVPVSGDVGALGAAPDFMATLDTAGGNVVLTWAAGQDVALRNVRTGAVNLLGTDLADRTVIELTVGRHGGEQVVAALIQEGSAESAVRAWSLTTGRLVVDQRLGAAGELYYLYLRAGEIVALTSAEGESQVVRWSLDEQNPSPAPLMLRRVGTSVWGDEGVPYFEGRFRRVPGGPPQLVFTVGQAWNAVVLIDLDRGTAQEINDAYTAADAATTTMLDGRPVVLEATEGTIEVSVPGDDDALDRDTLATLHGAQTKDLTVLAVTPEATIVASGGVDGTVRVWHDLSPEPDVFALRSPVRDLQIAEDHTILVLCNRGLVALHPRKT